MISLSSKDLQMESVKVYGPLLTLHNIAKKIKLPEILGEYSSEILSMAYAHCINYKSLRNMPKWYERTDLNLLLGLNSLTEARLVTAMDSINDNKIDDYQRAIFDGVKKIYKLDTKGLVYDTTNTYFHGKNCLMGKPGRSKDGQRKNDLIQIALVTTQKEGVPVFHKTFNGNIHDSRTLPSIIDHFPFRKIQPELFVYDRGIVSEKNMKITKEIGLDTLCGLPLREKEKKVIKRILKKSSVTQLSNMVKINSGVLYVKGVSYRLGSINGKLAICYNESKKLEQTQSRRLNVLEAQDLRKKGKQISEHLEKYLTPTGRVRESVLKEEEGLDGYMCLFCTRKSISEKEMVRTYFDKDVIEKAFKTLKGVSNVQPVRFWLDKRVKAHVFICYLSYLLLSILKMRLEAKGVGISPMEAISELETMYNVYFSDKRKNIKLTKTITLNRKQEKILRSIDPKILRDRNAIFT